MSYSDQQCFGESLTDYFFQPEGGRAAFYFFDYLLIKQYSLENKDWPLGEVNTVSVYSDHRAKWFRIHRNQTEYSETLERFIKHPRLTIHLLKYLNKQHQTAIKLSKISLRKKNNLELAKMFGLVIENFYRLLRPSSIIRMIDLGILSEFKNFAEKLKWSIEISALLSANEKNSFALSEEKEVLLLANKMFKKKLSVKNSCILSRLEKIRCCYCFSELGYYNEPVKSLNFYQEKLLSLKTEEVTRRLVEIKNNQKEILKKKRAFLKNADKRLKIISFLASELAYVKDCYKFFMNHAIYLSESLFVEIGNRVGRAPEFLKDLSPDEIKSLLLGGSVEKPAVDERIANHVLITFKKKFYVLLGNAAREFKNKYLVGDIQTNVLSGRCASLGRAIGKVRVILGPQDFYKMNRDDVLVVMNTSPDFTPILKKAVAIVAEEGGLTAHVSIVSREMKIPAIVGVVHVTEILKDGDLVEVDATSGIIKKL